MGIGRTFQTPEVFKTLSIRDNIRVGATFGKAKKDRSSDVIDFLGLSEKADQPVANKDLFTTKMTMVGAVLATDVKLLMLDEPMAGFSLSEMNQFVNVIERINKESGVTIIIIEHLLDIMVKITERMMILHYGTPLFLGNSDDVTKDRQVVEVYLGTSKGGKDAER